MARRMSNRDRIEHLRAEADAAAKEKAARQAEKAAEKAARPASSRSPTKAAAQPAGRVRLAWNVCDQRGDTVEQFPYAQEKEAREAAARLTEESGRQHFVAKGEVPVE